MTQPPSRPPAARKAKKPAWVIDKERARRAAAAETVWLFGLHAVRDALLNPVRTRLRLVLTRNAADRLAEAVTASGLTPEIVDARVFDRDVPLSPDSVHQGAAIEVKPLAWGNLADVVLSGPDRVRPLVVALDRVTDPHNVGAILRSAEVFGARAVISTARHAAPETGALAKTASGALERQPYLRITNLADTLVQLKGLGFVLAQLAGWRELLLSGYPVRAVAAVRWPAAREDTPTMCTSASTACWATSSGVENSGPTSTSKPSTGGRWPPPGRNCAPPQRDSTSITRATCCPHGWST